MIGISLVTYCVPSNIQVNIPLIQDSLYQNVITIYYYKRDPVIQQHTCTFVMEEDCNSTEQKNTLVICDTSSSFFEIKMNLG